jgi:hypothetical protein
LLPSGQPIGIVFAQKHDLHRADIGIDRDVVARQVLVDQRAVGGLASQMMPLGLRVSGVAAKIISRTAVGGCEHRLEEENYVDVSSSWTVFK